MVSRSFSRDTWISVAATQLSEKCLAVTNYAFSMITAYNSHPQLCQPFFITANNRVSTADELRLVAGSKQRTDTVYNWTLWPQ